MKVRIYSPFLPLPRNEGSYFVVVDQIFSLLKLGHEVELVVWKTAEPQIPKLLKTETMPYPWGDVKITSFLKQPASSGKSKVSAFQRVMRMALTDAAMGESFYYDRRMDLRKDLAPADLGIYHYSFAYNWLKTWEVRPEKRRVVHFHNLESNLYALRAQESEDWTYKSILARNAEILRRHEEEIKKVVDELWFLSPEDQSGLSSSGQLISEQTGVKSRLVPPTFSESYRTVRNAGLQKSREDQVVVGIVGGMDFIPNADSVAWILKEVAPHLQRLGFKGRMLIGGKNPTKDIRQLASQYSFVELLGFVGNMDEFYSRLSFAMVPHLTGSGVRTKLLESVASGIPVLCNQKAVALVHDEVRKSPFVMAMEDGELWARRIIAEEAAFETRKHLLNAPSCPGLDGARVYAFLKNSV